MAQDVSFQSIPISFAERAASSDLFKTLFRDGMALVEETAAYLDGEGRDAAKSLPRSAALAYASESMRLTTRLMQMASWLLLQRAVNEGELSQVEALSDKKRTCARLERDRRPRGAGAPAGGASRPDRRVLAPAGAAAAPRRADPPPGSANGGARRQPRGRPAVAIAGGVLPVAGRGSKGSRGPL